MRRRFGYWHRSINERSVSVVCFEGARTSNLAPALPGASSVAHLPHQAGRVNTRLSRLIGSPTGNRPGLFSLGGSTASLDPMHLAFEEFSSNDLLTQQSGRG